MLGSSLYGFLWLSWSRYLLIINLLIKWVFYSLSMVSVEWKWSQNVLCSVRMQICQTAVPRLQLKLILKWETFQINLQLGVLLGNQLVFRFGVYKGDKVDIEATPSWSSKWATMVKITDTKYFTPYFWENKRHRIT